MSGATGRGGLAFLGGAFGVGVAAILVKNVLPKDLTRTRRDSLAASGGEYRMLSSEVQLEIRGLQNVGNSCFINAVLQSLASLPPFREYLEALSPPSAALRAERAKESPFTSELLTLMNGLRAEKRTPTFRSSRILSPHKLRSLLRDRVDRFGKDDQQDAQELFQMVMRLVGEEAAVCLKNRDKENLVRMSEIDGAGGFADLNPEKLCDSEDDKPKRLPENPLSGSLAYVRRCTECNHASTRVERFVDLSLTLPEARHHMVGHAMRRMRPVDLATILKDFTQQQLVEDVECPTCAVRSALEVNQEDSEEDEDWELPPKRVRAHMRMLLGEAPKTLCLHFPRRHQSPSGLEMKLEQHVNFPLHLDVSPFCYTGGYHTDSIGLPTALQAQATLASSLPQLATMRSTKAPPGPGVVPPDALLPTSPGNPPTLAKALQSPQPHPGAKQALVGGSVEGANAAPMDGSRNGLGGLHNGAGGVPAGGAAPGNVRGRVATAGQSLPDREGVDYDLRAVIVHQGSADNGHYTAFRKLESGEEGPGSMEDVAAGLGVSQEALRERGGTGKEDWVDISDETVKRVSVRNVLASQAYMLFYRRTRPEAYCEGLS